MLYEYVCDICGDVTGVRASMKDGHDWPMCPKIRTGVGDFHDQDRAVTLSAHGPMRRLYGAQPAITLLDSVGYIEKAYRGEEPVPGLTHPQVKAIVDAQVTRNHRGRKNNASRRTSQR